ncbi:MAG: hypothetical protein AB7F19_04390 [Candidatus Babeliales bacterium]
MNTIKKILVLTFTIFQIKSVQGMGIYPRTRTPEQITQGRLLYIQAVEDAKNPTLFAQAEKGFLESLNLSNDATAHADIWVHLGILYRNHSMIDKAQEAFEKALFISNDPFIVANTRLQLAKLFTARGNLEKTGKEQRLPETSIKKQTTELP